MKNVVIEVNGGFVDVIANKEGLNVLIIDHDVEEEKEQPTGKEDVIIEVFQGLPDVTYCKEDIEVEIIDNDVIEE
jgi:glutathionylspermidine synthase